MNPKRTGALLALVLLVGGLAACGGDSKAEAPEKVVTIGVVAPLEEGDTEFGLGIRNSVQMAVDQANRTGVLPGWTIKVEAVDDSSTPDVGKKNAEKLVDDPSVVGVVGTYNSGVAAVVAPELEKAGIAMASPGNTNPSLTVGPDPAAPQRQYDNYFRMIATDAQQGGFLARYARQDAKYSKAAIVTLDRAVGVGFADDFRKAFEAEGGTVTSYTKVPEGATDYTEYARQAGTGGPDVIFFASEYQQAALLKNAAIAQGITLPMMGGDGMQSAQYIAEVGQAAQGDIASSVGAPTPSQPNGAAFLDAYTAGGYEQAPSNFGPYAYDAAAGMLEVLRNAVAGKTRVDAGVRKAVIDGLQSLKTAPVAELERTMNGGAGFANGAVTGELGFDAYGDTTNRVLTVYRVQAGEWVPIITRGFAG